jgi:lipoprotein-anchoring transpeptidase ErfK/SrfK
MPFVDGATGSVRVCGSTISALLRLVVARARLVAVVGAVLALTVACMGSSGSTEAGQGSGGGSGDGGRDVAPVTLQVQPAAEARDVAPGTPVVVAAAGGTLGAVRVASTGGASLAGELDTAKATWTSTGRLGFGTTYRVTAAATSAAGERATLSSTFTTVSARAQVFPAVAPLRGTVMGVGLPIRVYFDSPVSNRKAATDRMTVTTSVPTEGAWRWFSPSEVHWRPRVYWTAGTKIRLDISLYGVDLGGGVWGGLNADRHLEFSVGPSHVSVADARTYRMKVYSNGRLLRTLPVSMGKEVRGQYTKSGPHVVIEKNRVKKMDSRTYGLALDAGGYTAKVEWATRISNNGEFAHSAPWSVPQQGRTNVSHGCINLSPSNARWFFHFSKLGDVVEVVGTPVKLGPKDGDIYDWSIPWSQWANG